jgi:multiple sugar transport system substrate-binding protein
MHTLHRQRALATVSTLVISLTLGACGGDSGDSGGAQEAVADQAQALPQDEIDAALAEPTTLTFWSWVPDIEKQVALFEEAYPAVDVEVVNAGQGLDQYTKLRTALTAGEGAPDVAQIEFQYIPSFTVNDSLLDLRPYGAEELESQFVDWTWSQVKGDDGGVYAIPQDTGPMGMLYREDILSAAGIEPPKTWEEFAEAARTLRASNPDVYFTNLAPNDPGAYTGLLWQAGAEPFTEAEDGRIGINLADEAATQVADYWSGLVQEDVVSTDPDFTDQWYQGLNTGKYATWLTAAWGPAFLSGSAKDTAGKWRAAPLPQWEGSEEVAGNWGGSTSAVLQTSENPIAAAAFAMFINSDPASTEALANEQFLFPATTALLQDPAFIEQESEFYGGQRVNEVFAAISETVDTSFVWSPFQDQVFSDWNETVGAALVDKGDVAEGTRAWQDRVVGFAETQGFTVDK